jgi:hypothetical protein
MAKTAICGLLRIGWDTVGRIVARVVADHLTDSRLEGCGGVEAAAAVADEADAAVEAFESPV